MSDDASDRPLTRRERRLREMVEAGLAPTVEDAEERIREEAESARRAESESSGPEVRPVSDAEAPAGGAEESGGSDEPSAGSDVDEIEISPTNPDGSPRTRREIRALRDQALAARASRRRAAEPEQVETESAAFEESAGLAASPAEAGQVSEAEVAPETESAPEAEQSAEAERPVETGAVSEAESAAEAEDPAESEADAAPGPENDEEAESSLAPEEPSLSDEHVGGGLDPRLEDTQPFTPEELEALESDLKRSADEGESEEDSTGDDAADGGASIGGVDDVMAMFGDEPEVETGSFYPSDEARAKYEAETSGSRGVASPSAESESETERPAEPSESGAEKVSDPGEENAEAFDPSGLSAGHEADADDGGEPHSARDATAGEGASEEEVGEDSDGGVDTQQRQGYSFPDIAPLDENLSIFDHPERAASVAAADEPGDFDDLISRAVAQEGSPRTTNSSALILPSLPDGSGLSGPLGETGDLYITGSIEMPKSLGETGGREGVHDTSDVDPLDELGFDALKDTGDPIEPVSARKAVSSTGAHSPIGGPQAKEKSKVPLVLILTGGGLLIAIAGLVAWGASSGTFG